MSEVEANLAQSSPSARAFESTSIRMALSASLRRLSVFRIAAFGLILLLWIPLLGLTLSDSHSRSNRVIAVVLVVVYVLNVAQSLTTLLIPTWITTTSAGISIRRGLRARMFTPAAHPPVLVAAARRFSAPTATLVIPVERGRLPLISSDRWSEQSVQSLAEVLGAVDERFTFPPTREKDLAKRFPGAFTWVQAHTVAHTVLLGVVLTAAAIAAVATQPLWS